MTTVNHQLSVFNSARVEDVLDHELKQEDAQVDDLLTVTLTREKRSADDNDGSEAFVTALDIHRSIFKHLPDIWTKNDGKVIFSVFVSIKDVLQSQFIVQFPCIQIT